MYTPTAYRGKQAKSGKHNAFIVTGSESFIGLINDISETRTLFLGQISSQIPSSNLVMKPLQLVLTCPY